MEDSIVNISDVSHRYKDLQIVDSISLSIGRQESVCIVGPSGCGKSTLLRLLLGLEIPSSGRIHLSIPTSDLGVSFQEDNLLPWLDVEENLLLLNNLNRKNVDRTDLKRLLNDFALESFLRYYPAQLSGGMKQKLAILRSILYRPLLYVLDESMANIDDFAKFRLCDELYSLVRNENRSILFITHNLSDALHLADRIIIATERPLSIAFEIRNRLPRQRDYRIRFTTEFHTLMEELRRCTGQL